MCFATWRPPLERVRDLSRTRSENSPQPAAHFTRRPRPLPGRPASGPPTRLRPPESGPEGRRAPAAALPAGPARWRHPPADGPSRRPGPPRAASGPTSRPRCARPPRTGPRARRLRRPGQRPAVGRGSTARRRRAPARRLQVGLGRHFLLQAGFLEPVRGVGQALVRFSAIPRPPPTNRCSIRSKRSWKSWTVSSAGTGRRLELPQVGERPARASRRRRRTPAAGLGLGAHARQLPLVASAGSTSRHLLLQLSHRPRNGQRTAGRPPRGVPARSSSGIRLRVALDPSDNAFVLGPELVIRTASVLRIRSRSHSSRVRSSRSERRIRRASVRWRAATRFEADAVAGGLALAPEILVGVLDPLGVAQEELGFPKLGQRGSQARQSGLCLVALAFGHPQPGGRLPAPLGETLRQQHRVGHRLERLEGFTPRGDHGVRIGDPLQAAQAFPAPRPGRCFQSLPWPRAPSGDRGRAAPTPHPSAVRRRARIAVASGGSTASLIRCFCPEGRNSASASVLSSSSTRPSGADPLPAAKRSRPRSPAAFDDRGPAGDQVLVPDAEHGGEKVGVHPVQEPLQLRIRQRRSRSAARRSVPARPLRRTMSRVRPVGGLQQSADPQSSGRGGGTRRGCAPGCRRAGAAARATRCSCRLRSARRRCAGRASPPERSSVASVKGP